jgi:hypothetical protein
MEFLATNGQTSECNSDVLEFASVRREIDLAGKPLQR